LERTQRRDKHEVDQVRGDLRPGRSTEGHNTCTAKFLFYFLWAFNIGSQVLEIRG
jgi:hypothetical protein